MYNQIFLGPDCLCSRLLLGCKKWTPKVILSPSGRGFWSTGCRIFFIWFADITVILFFLHQNIEDVICSTCVHLRERETARGRKGGPGTGLKWLNLSLQGFHCYSKTRPYRLTNLFDTQKHSLVSVLIRTLSQTQTYVTYFQTWNTTVKICKNVKAALFHTMRGDGDHDCQAPESAIKYYKVYILYIFCERKLYFYLVRTH